MESMGEPGQAVAAPALSTAQDEAEAFARVAGYTDELLREKRQHLGPEYVGNTSLTPETTREMISQYYSLEKLGRFLNAREAASGSLKYPLVSLQFPDELIADSTIVSQVLQELLNRWNKEYHDQRHREEPDGVAGETDFTTPASRSQTMSRDIESVDKTIDSKSCGGNCGSKCKNKDKYNQEVWILADTSYSPCCIDEVAAEHVHADIVVHFGDACLNPVEKIESCYVFGRPYVDYERLKNVFRENHPDREQKVAIMADTPYSYVLRDLYRELKDEYRHLVVADIDFEKAGENTTLVDGITDPVAAPGLASIRTANRMLHGFNQADLDEYLADLDTDDENFIESSKFDGLTQEYSLFHITRPHDARILLLTSKFGDLKIVDPHNVELVHDQFPTLMKRYRNMQVARGASTVGILVNTLSLQNTKTLLNQTIQAVVEAGKKHYMFVVGKPNIAKLANFECVDVWCILGCGQSGIVIDMYGDYYKPIITPYELQLALMPQVTWTGKWVTDFDALLQSDGAATEEEAQQGGPADGAGNSPPQQDADDDDDSYAPEFDPVTGKLTMNKPLRQLRHLELELETSKDKSAQGSEETGLVKKFSGTLALGSTVSTSALGLQGRQWTGLGSDFTDEDSGVGAIVEEGRTGVARGYSGV